MQTLRQISIQIIFLISAFVLSSFRPSDRTEIWEMDWEEYYADEQLKDLIRIGLENNTDLFAAKERIIQSEAQLKAAKLGFVPDAEFKLSVPLEYGVSWEPVLSSNLVLDVSGKVRLTKKRAQTILLQNEINSTSVRSSLIAAIADYYYTLEMLDAKLEISRSTAATWKENVRIMKAMKKAGLTNEASISQTEANALSVEASLHDLECNIEKTETAMLRLLGIRDLVIRRGDLRKGEINGDPTSDIPVEVLSGRPDVKVAELELKRCYYDKALAKSAFYPSLSITGKWGWEMVFNAGLSLAQPIFKRGQLKSALRVAESEERTAHAKFNQTLLNATMDVNDALAQCRASLAKQSIRENQIESLRNAEKSTKQLMKASKSTYLEVLTAQQTLLSARLLQVSDSYEYIQGMISLFYSLGKTSQ